MKLRDITAALGYDAEWDKERRVISVTSEDIISDNLINGNIVSNNVLTNIALNEPQLYDPAKPMVALTFDDGPSLNTPHILDTLNKYDASATFFVVGTNAQRYPDTLRNIVASGCQIGNHTYDHSNLTSVSSAQIAAKVNSVQNIVFNATGIYPSVLRPPYGSYNQRVKDAINLRILNWSVDTRDWQSRNSESVYAAVMRNLKDGNVILMHDLYGSTASAVDKIVPELKKRGYQMVTVDQLYEARGELSGLVKA